MNDAVNEGLSAHDVRFRRDGRDVLRGVSVEMRPGTFTGLLGPNGSGKTTLLRLLLGLIEPMEGEVRLHGVPLRGLTRMEIARQIAYVPQAHHAAFPYSVAEMVTMGRTPVAGWGARPSCSDQEVVEQSLARMGLTHLRHRSYAALSGGERQSVLIARALAQGARLLLLDEPTASLDLGQQVRVMELLRELTAEGHAILMPVHQPDTVLRWCDRAVLLESGQVLASGQTADVVTAERLSALYGLDLRISWVEGKAFILR